MISNGRFKNIPINSGVFFENYKTKKISPNLI